MARRFLVIASALLLALGVLTPVMLVSGGVAMADATGWKQANKDGFGVKANNTAFLMLVYADNLYASTLNPEGPQLWQYDGTAWKNVDVGTFGALGSVMASMAIFNDQIFIGTYNASTGCQVWRLSGTSTLTKVNEDGFGDANNTGATSMTVYNGKLYVGTTQPEYGTGGEVWCTSGEGDAPFSDWQQVNDDGFGNAANTGAVSMAVYGNLCVGTRNKNGSQVWRYDGKSWASANLNGFGEKANTGATSMLVLGGGLFVGTENSAGCQVWLFNGSTWTREASKGFDDKNNTGAMSMTLFKGDLYVGTRNQSTGCEVWKFGGGAPVPPTPPPVLPTSFYFAEGYTGQNFQEYLCIGNAGSSDATAAVVYMFPDGNTQEAVYQVPANSRFTVDVNATVGPNKEVSIAVISDAKNLVAERPMYFNYNGVWTGGSDAVGAVAPSLKWYFAEGTTIAGFDEYITVQNPGLNEAHLLFHYMIEGVGEAVFSEVVRPHSRATFNAANHVGTGENISLFLESDQYVVAERPMYFDYRGLRVNDWTGGHCVVGATAPAKTWYLAEGTTRAGFEEWLCIQNPGDEELAVDADYMVGAGQGGPVHKTYKVPAKQRLTVSVNLEVGAEKDVSVKLSSGSAFLAERPLYFDYHSAWTGGSDVIGALAPATDWFFAEGYTGNNFAEWLSVQNPGTANANLTVTYYPKSGKAFARTWMVPPGTRTTIPVNQDAGPNLEISARIHSDQPVICERPMYFNFQGWTGGHDVVGYVPARD